MEQLVELVAVEAGIGRGCLAVDIGCGYGATARQLAARHGARISGLTITNGAADYFFGIHFGQFGSFIRIRTQ